jgi:methanogenic corrinoid protein MtbC1
MKDDEISKKVMSFSYSSNDLESQIEKLVIAMVDLDEAAFDKILSNAIMHDGFEQTIIKLIFPFFEKIGILWQTDSINPAQEHFVSNLLRQKIMVAIDNLMIPDKENAKKFILFLPEDEFHELGLLFYNYLIKKAGQSVIYLGSSVPLEDLAKTTDVIQPDYLFTAITTSIKGMDLHAYIEELSKNFPDQRIYITGLQVRQKEDISLPPNVEEVISPLKFSEKLRSL